MWLDNKSIEPVPFLQVNPFLQAYCLRYSKAVKDVKYEATVDKAYNEALLIALEYCEEPSEEPSEERNGERNGERNEERNEERNGEPQSGAR